MGSRVQGEYNNSAEAHRRKLQLDKRSDYHKPRAVNSCHRNFRAHAQTGSHLSCESPHALAYEGNTAILNVELVKKKLTGRAFLDDSGYDQIEEYGGLVHFKYPIDSTKEFIKVAIPRPKTMLSDSAITVHPNHKRYKHLLGKHV